jgi:superfamily II DNA helicase RecQ
VEFGQESGRVGRGKDAETCRSTLILSDREYQQLLTCDVNSLSENERGLRHFICTTGCRREALSEFMDGQDLKVSCLTIKGAKYDFCVGQEGVRASAQLS